MACKRSAVRTRLSPFSFLSHFWDPKSEISIQKFFSFAQSPQFLRGRDRQEGIGASFFLALLLYGLNFFLGMTIPIASFWIKWLFYTHPGLTLAAQKNKVGVIEQLVLTIQMSMSVRHSSEDSVC